MDPSDRLLEVLRRLGAPKQEMTPSDRLAEDLHLDSLAMVQLQSTLETAFRPGTRRRRVGTGENGGRSARSALSAAIRGWPDERQCDARV